MDGGRGNADNEDCNLVTGLFADSTEVRGDGDNGGTRKIIETGLAVGLEGVVKFLVGPNARGNLPDTL